MSVEIYAKMDQAEVQRQQGNYPEAVRQARVIIESYPDLPIPTELRVDRIEVSSLIDLAKKSWRGQTAAGYLAQAHERIITKYLNLQIASLAPDNQDRDFYFDHLGRDYPVLPNLDHDMAEYLQTLHQIAGDTDFLYTAENCYLSAIDKSPKDSATQAKMEVLCQLARRKRGGGLNYPELQHSYQRVLSAANEAKDYDTKSAIARKMLWPALRTLQLKDAWLIVQDIAQAALGDENTSHMLLQPKALKAVTKSLVTPTALWIISYCQRVTNDVNTDDFSLYD